MREGFIGDKSVKNIEIIKGFGNRKFYVHTSPSTGSVIQPDFNQIQQYEQSAIKHQQTNVNDIGYNIVSKQEQPINLTKEQKKAEQKISRGDYKQSMLTACPSQMSVINEREEDQTFCYRCVDKQHEIQKLKQLIQQKQDEEGRLVSQNKKLINQLWRYKELCKKVKQSINESHSKSRISASQKINSQSIQPQSYKSEILKVQERSIRQKEDPDNSFESLYRGSFEKIFVQLMEHLEINLPD